MPLVNEHTNGPDSEQKNTNLGQAPLVDTKQVTKKYSRTLIQNMNFHSVSKETRRLGVEGPHGPPRHESMSVL